MEAELNTTWSFLGGTIHHTTWLVSFPGGSWIQFFGAKDIDTARGIRCDLATLDECDDIESSDFDSVVNPWLSEPWSLNMRLLGGTPKRGRYGLLYRTYCRGLGKELDEHGNRFADHSSIHATCYDSPETVSLQAIENARRETSPEIFRREWLCDFDSAEGLVYDLFKESFHVRSPHPDTQWREFLIGVDHGYEDPGVFVVIGVYGHGRDAVCHVLEEVYEHRKTESWWIDKAIEFREKYPNARWYADPSMPARIHAYKKEAGIFSMEPAKNDVKDGIAAVANLLVTRTDEDRVEYSNLYVSGSCTESIREFGLYRRKRDTGNRELCTDDIEDKNNHAMDAIRYALFSRFGKPSYDRYDW